MKLISLAFILTSVSYASYAKEFNLTWNYPTEREDGQAIVDGEITESGVNCDNGTSLIVLAPVRSVVVNFAPRLEDYICSYTVTAGVESLPSVPVSISVPLSRPNPPTPTGISPTSINLSWTAPTENTDNSKLTNLESFNVYYGTNENDLNTIINVDNPSTEELRIVDLTPNTYYFAVSAVNSQGVQSELSDIVTKTLQE